MNAESPALEPPPRGAGRKPPLLSQRLADSFAQGFFRPLARPSAPLYVDCADRLEQAGDEGGQLSHEDAVIVIRETLALHPGVQLEADEGGDTQDLRMRAGKLFNNLLAARWLEDRTASLDERRALISPALRPLLRMLRDLAEDEIAELKGFADMLRLICHTLLAENALDPSRLTGEEMRSTVNGALEGVRNVIEQMHAVEKAVVKFEDRQRRSASGQATLRLFYTDFYEGEHIVCYDTLQRGGLLAQINRARSAALEACSDPFARQRLAEGLAAHKKLGLSEAEDLAEEQLRTLERSLGRIRSTAEIIDARVASFNRLSAQRYRYQTEIRGRRPELVKAFLAAVNVRFQGRRFSDLTEAADLQMLCPEAEVYFGHESLARGRRPRAAANLSLGDRPPEAGALDAQALIRKRALYAITPHRGSRFVQKFLPEKGARLCSSEFSIRTEDDLFDLIAVLCFDRYSDRASFKTLRWRVEFARAGGGLEPEKIATDVQSGYRFERFTIERLS
jgi:hypothetical protein